MSVHDISQPPLLSSADVDDLLAANLMKYLTCSVCTKRFTKPRTLPCYHSFCKACLTKLEKKFCPICKAPFDTQAIPAKKSKIIARVSKLHQVIKPSSGYGLKLCGQCSKTPPSIFCPECNIFSCSECFKIHEQWKPLDEHKSVTLEKFKVTITELCVTSRVERKCSNHKNMLLEYYCDSCQEIVCFSCIPTEHKGHEIQRINNSRTKHENAVKKAARHVEHKTIRLESNIVEIEKRKEEITSRGKEIKNEISSKLRKLEEDLLGQVSALVGRKISNLDAQIELINEEFNSLTKYIKTVQEKLEAEDYEELKELLMKTNESSEEEVSHESSEEEVSSEAIEIRNAPVESANLVLAVDVSSVKLEIEQENSIIQKKFNDAEIVHQETPIVNKSCTWVVSLKQSFDESPLPAQNIVSYLDPFTSEDTRRQHSGIHQKTRVQCEVKPRDEEAGLYEITFTPCVSGPHVLKMRYSTEPATSIYADLWIGEISLNVLIEPIPVQDEPDRSNSWRRHITGTMVEQETTEVKLTTASSVSNQHDVYILNESRRKVHIGYIIDDGISKGCTPKGIDYTSEGNVILVTYDLNKIKEVSVNGHDIHRIEKTGDGQLEFNGPTAVVVDRQHSKKIFILEKKNQRIQVLNSDFTFSHFIPICPSDMALDSKGQLYTIDKTNSQNVTVIDIQSGRELHVIKLEDIELAATQPNVERVLDGITINKNDLMLITSSEYDKQSKKFMKASNTQYTSDGRKIIPLANENSIGLRRASPNAIEIPYYIEDDIWPSANKKEEC